ncbi:phosphoglucomutase-1-like [Schistocerca piceifrons]|uniref:phosphoglucomutase-1-like n=1 Tax=Schistocerca piceifrons TaxID=274613 RepID=UPI001F5F38B5|nr:phosphoglucomutase-1-like [Schistocerca piceifrons]
MEVKDFFEEEMRKNRVFSAEERVRVSQRMKEYWPKRKEENFRKTVRHIVSVDTTPYLDQNPGTSGLRRPTLIYRQKNYAENYIECILKVLGDTVVGSTIVVGGDGRYLCEEVAQKVIRQCAANGVYKVIAAHNALMTTPAISAVIRKYGALGGFVLTASHNPAGLLGDFGIKFNGSNGGPAPLPFTKTVHITSRHIESYKTLSNLTVDLSDIATHWFNVEGREFLVQVIDSVDDYVQLVKDIFDFPHLSRLLTEGLGGEPFRLLVDCMHGSSGPYARRIFCDEMGAPPERQDPWSTVSSKIMNSAKGLLLEEHDVRSTKDADYQLALNVASTVMNGKPVEDFGNHPADPNMTRASQLLQRARAGACDLGAALDGDGDRCLLVGRGGLFVPPADSLAVLAAHLCCIPYFYSRTTPGFARSMPTAAAVDRVAKELGLECYERGGAQVPTGWKYFGNLMDAGLVCLCGEESFGTGSDHIREKDALWAVLAWLSVVADLRLHVHQILADHWKHFGRHYFQRYDFEKCNRDSCKRMMFALEQLVASGTMVGECFGDADLIVEAAEKYRYVDPIDGTVTKDQGIWVRFEGDSRLVFRLGGTDSSGSTVRIYCERYEPDPERTDLDPAEVVQPLYRAALDVLRLEEFTGRTKPDVVT